MSADPGLNATVHILFIEDDEDDYLIVRDLISSLENHPYKLTWARDHQTASEEIRDGGHDICLLDFRFGEHSGLDLLPLTQEPGNEMPVIVLTGFNDPLADQEAMNAGASDYLEKSGLTAKQLERSIRYALSTFSKELDLRRSEERYALAADGSNDGLWDWDLNSDYIYFSQRWLDMLGYARDPFDGDPEKWFAIVHPEDVAALRQAIDNHVVGASQFLHYSYRIRHQNGQYRWMQCRAKAVRDSQRMAYRIAGSQTDITPQKELEEQLRNSALHDALTGLANKLMLHDHLELALSQRRDRERGRNCALMFLDADNFKEINDTYGHEVGDRVLVKLANRLKASLRKSDTVARFGGDEFVILLTDLDDELQVDLITRHLMDSLCLPFQFGELELFLSSSMGVTYIPPGDNRSATEILRDADTALYEAKESGKARHSVFNAQMRRKAVDLMQLKGDLRSALPKREFELHYQPVIELKNNRAIGLEALLRWRRSGRDELLTPRQFLPVAEDIGLLREIGLWVFREACEQSSKWRKLIEPTLQLFVSINLSPSQLATPDLTQKLSQIVRETDADQNSLNIEITEASIIGNHERIGVQLRNLKSLGLKLCLDDFGSGYSSLRALHELPFDLIKIDKSFVSYLQPKKHQSEQLMRSILAIANIYKMQVVAEGVESRYQADLLRDMGCQLAQGHFFAQAMDADSVANYLQSHTRDNSAD